ncbi:MAG: hypothetical protein RSB29_04415 [Alistipes sp.]
MKLLKQFQQANTQTKWMIALIVLLLLMIATRWGYIAHTAGAAFQQRFAPVVEQADSITDRP